MIIVTEEMLKKVADSKINVKDLVRPIQEACDEFGVHNTSQLYAFLANCAHESAGFRVFEENLNYSETGLLKIFGKYFNTEQAKRYARKPVAIANRVYANRLGNGPEASGDGWSFRGVGAIQLTGRDHHESFAEYMGITHTEASAFMNTSTGRFISAGWFWMHRAAKDLNDVTKDIPLKKITIIDVKKGKSNVPAFDLSCRYVNGSTIGYLDRVNRFNILV